MTHSESEAGRAYFRSFATPLILFGIFLSVPRIWYLLRSGVNPDRVLETVLVVIVGLLRDLTLPGALLVLLHLFGQKIYSWSVALLDVCYIFLTALFAVLLSVSMLNVEFLRLFGSHSNLDHLSMVSVSGEGISLFAATDGMKLLLAAEALGLPLLFVWLSFRKATFWRLNWWLKSTRGFRTLVGLFCVGAPLHFLTVTDPALSNLMDNYIFNFVKTLALNEEISGRSKSQIRDVLDTLPLPGEANKNPSWTYFDSQYPLMKATDHHLCRMGLSQADVCARDADGDGFQLKVDCNDHDGKIFPGAEDKPRNGIDEDCSGLDADPPNVILIHWEGARAVNVGRIGFDLSVTPRFDELTKEGVLFKNAYTNGTQTRFSLVSMYCSILPRLATKWIFKHNPDLHLLSVADILRLRGYDTIYVHSGDTNFSQLSNRISKWFETVYDRTVPPISEMKRLGWGITDRELFDLCWRFLNKRQDKRPFFMAIATLSLHYPFTLPEERFAVGNHKKAEFQIPNIIHYSDDAMGDFISKVLSDPKLENTIVIVAADHGMNWHRPHKTATQNTMYEDLVWIPMALLGKNWNVQPKIDEEIRQLADIPPTICDRLGIEVPNAFVGKSLLRSYKDRKARAFFSNSNGGLSAGMREGRFKYLVHYGTKRHWLYDVEADREEKFNLADDAKYATDVERFYKIVTAVYAQNTELVKSNRLWHPRFWLKND